MQRICYAHSLEDASKERWHRLETHLAATATRAERFAAYFAPGWGTLAGLWHDAGKYQEEFQRHIGAADAHCEDGVGKVDHSGVGALIAASKGSHGLPLAMVIAGHHGGLQSRTKLDQRLERNVERLDAARRGGLPKDIEAMVLAKPPAWIGDKATAAMWIRFLFSALVDADFLDTEEFYQGRGRAESELLLDALLRKLENFLGRFVDTPASVVNEMRRRVLADCRDSASRTPGVFRLTVPTGGGKTLSSLVFALHHAVKHSLERVIVVIPYTSILEQTADTYRQALGSREAVLEHHSNVDPEKEDHRSRQACENWDAPIVVTTSVQFFESLYSNKTSRTRKLHRIARSVVVFDEVQTFPPALLTPIEHALRQLKHYGTSLVLCTATQPALKLDAAEIVSNVEREFECVADRVRYLFPASEDKVRWADLAMDLRVLPQVLTIVHRRDDAAELAELVGPDCVHLSARMCPAHRGDVIARIKDTLKKKQDCRVVATQLVEAGVDLDFPVVYRAMAGADALAQAAGRCNREGLRSFGELRVFHAPTRPFRELGKAMDEALVMWREGRLDLTQAAVFREYFRRLYSASDTDPGVMAAEKEFDFPKSAELFEMIHDDGKPVVAPYGDSGKWVHLIRTEGINRDFLRRLQRYIVNLFPHEIQLLERRGQIEKIDGLEMWVTTRYGPAGCYSPRFGFVTSEAPLNPAELLV